MREDMHIHLERGAYTLEWVRAVAADCPQKRGAYLLQFTVYNVIFLTVLLALGLLLSKTTDFWAGTL